jgi:uncharacterized protein YbjT (DUF2867 family)
MPVVITGASSLIGRNAVAAFARKSPQVRAYIGRPDEAEVLRKLGAKVSVGEVLDVDQLEAVMSGAHTVCHLGSDVTVENEEAWGSTTRSSMEAVVQAAGAAGVRRVLYVSWPGASPDAENPYQRSLGVAERSLQGSDLEHVIVRCSRTYGPGVPWPFAPPRRSPVLRFAVVPGSGRQVVAPVFFQDLVDVLVGADDRERVASGVWGLEGPDRLTMDQLCDLVAGRRCRKLHLRPGARCWLCRLAGFRSSRALAELAAADNIADAPDAAGEFGVTRTSLAEGLRRSLPA